MYPLVALVIIFNECATTSVLLPIRLVLDAYRAIEGETVPKNIVEVDIVKDMD